MNSHCGLDPQSQEHYKDLAMPCQARHDSSASCNGESCDLAMPYLVRHDDGHGGLMYDNSNGSLYDEGQI